MFKMSKSLVVGGGLVVPVGFVVGRRVVVAVFALVGAVHVDALGVGVVGGLDRRGLGDVGRLLGIGETLDRGDLLAVFDAHHPHALGGAALDGHVLDADADELALVADQDEVVILGDDADRAHLAVARRRLD